MKIRSAVVADAEAMCAIYNYEVLQSKSTLDLVPRTLEEQQQWIADRSGGLRAVVADTNGHIAGFASLSFYRDRPGYRSSVEDSVYVDRTAQGQGVGSALVAELVETAKDHGFHTIMSRIVGPQEASVRLHKKFGFEMVGTERQVGRKFGQWHDVGLMQLILNEYSPT